MIHKDPLYKRAFKKTIICPITNWDVVEKAFLNVRNLMVCYDEQELSMDKTNIK